MFGIADYGAFVVAIIVFLAIPGPGNLALLTATAKGGVRAGMAATFGVIAGDQALLWMAVAGVATLLVTYPAAFALVQWLGAAYLAWLGFKLVAAKPGDAPVLELKPHHYLRQAFVITVFNPKAIVFFAAVLPQFVDTEMGSVTVQLISLGLIFAALAVIFDGAWGMIAGAAREWLSSSTRRLEIMRVVGGCVMILLGVVILATTPLPW